MLYTLSLVEDLYAIYLGKQRTLVDVTIIRQLDALYHGGGKHACDLPDSKRVPRPINAYSTETKIAQW